MFTNKKYRRAPTHSYGITRFKNPTGGDSGTKSIKTVVEGQSSLDLDNIDNIDNILSNSFKKPQERVIKARTVERWAGGKTVRGGKQQ